MQFTPVWVTFAKNYNARLFFGITESFKNINVYICDPFIEIYLLKMGFGWRATDRTGQEVRTY